MRTFRRAIRRYPLVAATLVVGAAGLLLLPTPWAEAAPWAVGIYAIAIALWEAVGMIRQLLRGRAGLDMLAVTAITAAVLVGEPWAALVVVLMITGGAALEDYAEYRSKRELTALLDRVPQRAARVLANGETEEVGVDEIEVDDELLVRPGELVPVDAVLLDAHAVFDESSLTGESLPVERIAGELVPSGAVGGSSAIRLRASAVAARSQFQQIVRLVEQASGSRARVVRLADRYALPFTAAALLIAGIAWAVSGDPVRFAEVLVVATPCPLLIAAPVAFLGGMSRAARFGLIVKGGSTLEQLARVRSVAFDKTGTLTRGRPELVRIEPEPGFTEEQVLRFAASAEVYSSHVLADSVLHAARVRDLRLLPVATAEEEATNGVVAVLEGGPDLRGPLRVGKAGWIEGATGNVRRPVLEAGELAVYVAIGDRFAGALVMRDRVRDEAAGVVAALGDLGVSRMLVVTGDVAATAEPIAASLGIDEVHSECTPGDKVRIVADVTPRPLLMAGDGLNDAPVLAAADVGFAMGARGSTAASESADVVNRFDDLSALLRALGIGRETVRVALQSIWIGIAISAALMLVAAFGLLPALAGAWLQEVVDLVAILWALRAIGPRSERVPAVR